MTMSAPLIAGWFSSPGNWLMMLLGIGLIIFVHEMGHFLVAKWCGVKCEKFYLGFDIGGWKICSFQWGETEYGIGILPLGGYVKMLGQDDNPARAAEEAERTRIRRKQAAELAEEAAESGVAVSPSGAGEEPLEETSSETPADGENAEADGGADEGTVQIDPRSYTAKSVPQRMAIISAGVIMNLLFAPIFAAMAYSLGVDYTPGIISGVAPGGPAYVEGFEVGDEVAKYGDQDYPKFQYLMKRLPTSEAGEPVKVVLNRKVDGSDPLTIERTVAPEKIGPFPSIGIQGSAITIVKDVFQDWPAGNADPGFKEGDKIVRVGDAPIESHGDLHRELARHAFEPVRITVERSAEESEEGQSNVTEVTIQLEPTKMRRLGLVMAMGKIVAVRKGMPAAEAGLKAGDFIERIDLDVAADDQPGDGGEAPGDPITLAERLYRVAVRENPAERHVTITVKRDGEELRRKIQLVRPDGLFTPYMPNHPLALPSLGVAVAVINRVEAVVPDSPADEAGLQKGDVLTSFQFVPTDEQRDDEYQRGSLAKFGFIVEEEDAEDYEKFGWPRFMGRLQMALPGTKVKLTYKRSGEDEPQSATVLPAFSDQWHHAERGLQLAPLIHKETAGSVGEALSLGIAETWQSLTLVFRTIKKLANGELWPHLGGMGTIFAVAGMEADKGLADLLIFMTLISANLAIINFLPIPVLDGGHMVFLIAEAIRGKPVSEKVLIPVTYLGLFLILGLFIYVTSLDIGRLFHWLGGQ